MPEKFEKSMSRSELFEKWRSRWRDFLEVLSKKAKNGGIEEALRDKVTIGNAERQIAGGHEGREVLELLQNARDAIKEEGIEKRGRVYVGLLDEGIMVANTGSSFDFLDEKVEEAVTMIGETGKGEERDAIGHKGVGLKSILATGDSFDVYTRLEKNNDKILGVRFSRSYILSAVASRLGKKIDFKEILKDVKDRKLKDIIQQSTKKSEINLDEKTKDYLSKLPLFNFPVPLDIRNDEEKIISHAKSLLLGKTEFLNEEGLFKKLEEPFRTVVFVRFTDKNWRELLEKLNSRPPENRRDIDKDERINRIWDYLSENPDHHGLKKETIVQLGGIGELYLENRSSGSSEWEKWDIESTRSFLENIRYEDITVKISDDIGTVNERFDQFRFKETFDPLFSVDKTNIIQDLNQGLMPKLLEDELEKKGYTLSEGKNISVEENDKKWSINGEENNYIVKKENGKLNTYQRGYNVKILVNKDKDYRNHLQKHPLYLYYPIENTAKMPLPFCLHGHFHVETNRKDLSNNSINHNKEVLKEATNLIKEIAVKTAHSPEKNPHFGKLYPWVILPPVSESNHVNDPSTQTELLEWFCDEVYQKIRNSACIATDIDGVKPVKPSNTLLHWDDKVLNAYIALQEIEKRVQEDSIENFLPHVDILNRYQFFPTKKWKNRLKFLVDPNEDSEFTKNINLKWSDILSNHLVGKGITKKVKEENARDIFKGTVELICKSIDDDEDVAELIGEMSLDGVFLLPCKYDDEEDNRKNNLQLVRIESRSDIRSTRSVIWDTDSKGGETLTLKQPSPQTSFTVFVFDEKLEKDVNVYRILDSAGRAWGIRKFEGIPSFYRSLLDTFAFGQKIVVEPIDFAFLTYFIEEIGERSDDLQTKEGGFFPFDYMARAITNSEGDLRENLRRRIELRDCQVKLEENGEAFPINETVLGSEWQTLLRELNEGSEEAESIDSLTHSNLEWPKPKHPCWEPIIKTVEGHDLEIDNQKLARVISLLGGSCLPGIQILWMYSEEHPDLREKPSWNPKDWTIKQTKISSLIDTLEEQKIDYLSWIISPDFHPAITANHSSKCKVKLEGLLEETNIASWVWFKNPKDIKEFGEDLIELLRRHDEKLRNSILQTGWTCNYNHGRRKPKPSVPTLLNWQIRDMPIWDSIVKVPEDISWGKDASKLTYAVVGEKRKGARASRLFPSISVESVDISEKMLQTLGVQEMDDLFLPQSELRLQKIQELLANNGLREEPTELNIPPKRENDWKQAYTKLLEPIMSDVPEESEDSLLSTLEERDFLTHLPLKKGETWVAASIDWIRDPTNRMKIRYFEDISPKPWERQKVANSDDILILPRTSKGPFTKFARYLNAEKLDATKPVYQKGDLELIGKEKFSTRLKEIKEKLEKRLTVLVASTEKKSEEEIIKTKDEMSRAINALEVAKNFPENENANYLSQPKSGLYLLEKGEEALVYNLGEFDDNVTLTMDDLARGFALLVTQPTKIAIFREALKEDISRRELEDKWKKRAFPVDTVRQVIGSQIQEKLENRFEALSKFFDIVLKKEKKLPYKETFETLDKEDEEIRELLLTWPSSYKEETENFKEYEEIEKLIDHIQKDIPKELQFVVKNIFSNKNNSWARKIKEKKIDLTLTDNLIKWLSQSKHLLSNDPFPLNINKFQRLMVVEQVWEKTDSDSLTDPETLKKMIKKFENTDKVDFEWKDEIPSNLTSDTQQVFFLCIEDKFEEIVSDFLSKIIDELPETSYRIKEDLRNYIYNKKYPDVSEEIKSKSYQEQAFEDVEKKILKNEDFGAINFEDEIHGIKDTKCKVSTGSGGHGGVSKEYKGRGERAEVFTIVYILNRLQRWIKNHTGNAIEELTSEFRALLKDQRNGDHKWHLKKTWDNQLCDILDNKDDLDEDNLVKWQNITDSDRSLSFHPFVRLINVTEEQGPGFDIIDPFGPLENNNETLHKKLNFLPVEVKAVGGTNPPFSFRLTTNEYNRLKAFLKAGYKYSIRLVYVPEPGKTNWISQCSFVAEKVYDKKEIPELVPQDKNFEEFVKGGYMNVEVDSS